MGDFSKFPVLALPRAKEAFAISTVGDQPIDINVYIFKFEFKRDIFNFWHFMIMIPTSYM